MAAKDGKPIVIIRKEEVVEGGHHGGAWKVAYADFVTAMMAFFLLMWLLNATTEAQRRGIADYFSPEAAITTSASGFGKPFGGLTPNSDGRLASDRGMIQVARTEVPILKLTDPPEDPDDQADTPQQPHAAADGDQTKAGPSPGAGTLRAMGDAALDAPLAPGTSLHAGDHAHAPTQARSLAPTDKDLQAELDRRERAAFQRAAQQIREAVQSDPALADLMPQLRIDITPEGLRVQLVDQDRDPMFATGSSTLNERARAVILKVAPILMRLPEPISIAGHTDSRQYRGSERSNWDLSADRANATRRLLVEAGVPEERINSVSGMADRDPLVVGDGLAAANRRIAITVLHERALAPRGTMGGASGTLAGTSMSRMAPGPLPLVAPGAASGMTPGGTPGVVSRGVPKVAPGTSPVTQAVP